MKRASIQRTLGMKAPLKLLQIGTLIFSRLEYNVMGCKRNMAGFYYIFRQIAVSMGYAIILTTH